ncbi:sulfate transporter CysZ [Candidatus Colwellia aromaticivorans]|uniref:sulfate transporter CysZ n=1 Tax=Candidatus Colwellia aromaticivorans TaxID=2267621 RepID=UPI00248271B7|nr:sulfate transporter CysZ [Candidatus Colwellia aromaticivorans]
MTHPKQTTEDTKFNQKQHAIANSGMGYFFKGFELIQLKGIRRFVLIPLLINILFFSIAFYFMFIELEHYMTILMGWLPNWLNWLSSVLWPLAVITILIIFSFIFSTAANWLAAPFNGLLSEKIELLLLKEKASQGSTNNSGMMDVVKDIPRTLARELQKLTYYLPRAIGFFILLWVLPVIGQVMWFLFVAWMMAVQYKDYPFDNHKVPFSVMKQTIQQQKNLSYSFGVSVTVFSMLPLVNLIVMPVAICGATALWVDHYRDDFISK